ncbi:MAG: OOP family OmpA-OmpF porin [Cyclobacteriaceae bacterium]|jgi:OOP family OmpA-OmpF porin
MKRIIFLCGMLAGITGQAQEAVSWAAQVVDVSSEFGRLEYSGLQTLHQPNVLPASGPNANAWRPKTSDAADFIMVSFQEPIVARQIAIAESENPGAITKVIAYDEEYREYTLFELTPRAIPVEKRLLNLFFDESVLGIKIQAVRVEIDGSAVPGYNAIDAIGISASTLPISVLIELAVGVNREIEAQALGENVNSPYVEHSPIISPNGKKLYFSRKYHPDNMGGVDDPEDIWVSEWDEEADAWKEAVNAGSPLNTAGPNFISSITSDGEKDVIILGNRYGKKGRMYAGISMATVEADGSFSKPTSLEVTNEYNYSPKADFFLVPGGQALILSVERDDSYGGRDLYVSFKDGNSWTEPKNLGGTINTAAEEAAPFLAVDGKTLYYSSGGFSGYGGLDIYVTRKLDNAFEKWSPPENMGSGINTDLDDQYFSIPSNGKHLYFTRGEVDSDTDIFRFKVDELFIDPNNPLAESIKHLEEDKEVVIVVNGMVTNSKDGLPMPGVKVNVERLPDGVGIGSVTTQDDGSYSVILFPGARYGLGAELDGFIAGSQNLDLNEIEKTDTLDVNLSLSPIEVGKPIVLNNIFFAFAKDLLTTSSYAELSRVLEYMESGRIEKIEVSGHTDSVGDSNYNKLLSQKRANSVKKFFTANGISSSRVLAKGMGEDQPVSTNETDDGRAKNRRVEFKVLEIGN